MLTFIGMASSTTGTRTVIEINIDQGFEVDDLTWKDVQSILQAAKNLRTCSSLESARELINEGSERVMDCFAIYGGFPGLLKNTMGYKGDHINEAVLYGTMEKYANARTQRNWESVQRRLDIAAPDADFRARVARNYGEAIKVCLESSSAAKPDEKQKKALVLVSQKPGSGLRSFDVDMPSYGGLGKSGAMQLTPDRFSP